MQPSKMQIFLNRFTPADRRTHNRRGHAPPPITVAPPSSGRLGADPGELTPTPRPGTSASRHEASGDGFYQQRSMARSQPELPSTRRQQPVLAAPNSHIPKGVLAPRKQSLGVVQLPPRPQPQHGSLSEGRVPTVRPTQKDEEPFAHAEGLDEVTSLPAVFGHRRGVGSGSQDSADIYAVYPDHSGSSMTSGFLSRGPSTNSTSRSEAAVNFRRLSLEACSVQQDFFLGGMCLHQSQRSQLLVSLPESVIAAYSSLYDLPWLAPATQQMWPSGHPLGLEEERLMARSRIDLDGDSQLRILQAAQAILKTAAGEQRLCRFVRWLLHSDAEDNQVGELDELLEVPALTAPEVRDLLEPLRLNSIQAKRLNKHCKFIPHRLEAGRGFASPVSYRGYH